MTKDELSLRQLNRTTLARQGLLERFDGAPATVIGRLAGLQAQHANQPYIALWSRLDGLTVDALQGALERRTVVRATVMRTTLHLVAAADYRAYDAAVAASRVANWAPTLRRAGIDVATLHQALLEFCREPRTIAEMEAHLDEVAPDARIARHVPGGVRHAGFRVASSGGGLVHVPPSGFWGEHGKNRYVDARVWLGERGAPMDPDVALETAIERYLGAYGPASFEDIAKWLGQARVGPLRAAIERMGDELVPRAAVDRRTLLDLAGRDLTDPDAAAPPRFLSRWDSVLIAYDARERILPPAYRAAVIKKNGDFLPTFLIDGFVGGRWSAETRKGVATLRLEPFGRVGAGDRPGLVDEAERLVRFIEPEATDHQVTWA